jgi:glycosyltransferase involved in cell wall biosynthesis
MPTIAIAVAIAHKMKQGGYTWVPLQYALGLRRLGWDVLLLDRLEPDMCRDAQGRPCSPEESANLGYFVDVMSGFGFESSFALLCDRGARFIGLSRAEVRQRISRCAFLLNVMGFLDDEEILGWAPRRVFLDIDPGFGQMWRVLGLNDVLRGHDDFVTIGENLGRPDCTIPDCGLHWITTPQPIVLEQWPVCRQSRGARLTSVVTWRGAYGPLEYGGRTYGLRVHEFRRFVRLPRLTGRTFELALDIHPAETADLALLGEHGWSLVDPRVVAGDPWDYRDYIQDSLAEFMVAKNMYVQSRAGWMSDRSLCYLASGKPVVAQDTGLGWLYPTGRGLLTYTTLDEAAQAVEEVVREPEAHQRAARELAEEYFDSDKVLARLLDRLGVASPAQHGRV